MIKLIVSGAVAVGALLLGAIFFDFEKVPAGNVGIKFNLYGSDKGVNIEEKPPGRYILGINEELYLFPTYTVTDTYVGQQAIRFQDREGLQLAGNFGITYAVDPTKVAILFQKYRKGIEEISDVYLRNIVRDSIVKAASSRDAEDMYGSGKVELVQAVEEDVRAQVATIGLLVESVYVIGSFGLPKNLEASINRKIEAQQIAQQKENELKQAQADAEKVRATAAGEKDAAILSAQGKAEALNIEGEALRKNPDVMRLRAIERWGGGVPAVVGDLGAVPFIQLEKARM